ncbi:MAG: glycosyltransferase family 2 protein [Patescibacteria group bacterium]|nr:glycosyltransferase family 2 protein [Patescibacteria group bacterium]
MKTPVLMIIFNRPQYTRRVFEAIRAARPERLYIACDGPRTKDERAAVEAARSATENVDWPCTVQRLYQDKNLGLRWGPPAGIGWFFEHEEAGIILEDDCLPHPDFFRFASEMLERYRTDTRIIQITGTNMMPEFPHESSYFFSKFFNLWGWAAWRRSWALYDPHMQEWPELKKERLIERSFREGYLRRALRGLIDDVYYGRHATWDIAWFLACIKANGLCVTPRTNLISNIGTEGVHSGSDSQNRPTAALYNKSLVEPGAVQADIEFDALWYRKVFYQSYPSWLRRKAWLLLMGQEWLKRPVRALLGRAR